MFLSSVSFFEKDSFMIPAAAISRQGSGGTEEKARNQQYFLSGLSKAHRHNYYISIVINQVLQWGC